MYTNQMFERITQRPVPLGLERKKLKTTFQNRDHCGDTICKTTKKGECKKKY